MAQSEEEWEPGKDDQPMTSSAATRRRSKYDLEQIDAKAAAVVGAAALQSPVVAEANDGTKPKRVRGAGPASPDKRRAQNRLAQQNFRQRRENYVKELEKRLEVEADNHARLRAQLSWLHERAGPSVMASMTDLSVLPGPPGSAGGSSVDSTGEGQPSSRRVSDSHPTSSQQPPASASSFAPPHVQLYGQSGSYQPQNQSSYPLQHISHHDFGNPPGYYRPLAPLPTTTTNNGLLSQPAPRPLGGADNSFVNGGNGYGAPALPSLSYGALSPGTAHWGADIYHHDDMVTAVGDSTSRMVA